MQIEKQSKLEELLRTSGAEYIQRESSGKSLITVTRASISDTQRNAIIYVTVLPEKEEAQALQFLKRKRSEFRSYMLEKLRARIIPKFDFEIDMGEKTRQKIDELGITQ